MEDQNKNNKKKIIIIVSILVLVGIIGGTLAYFMARATSSEQTITSANLKIVFDDSTPIINATDIEPIEEDSILTNAAKKTFRISKESNTGKDLYARIDMIDLNISDNFKDYDLKWALYEGTNKITTGTFVPTLDGSTSINMATNVLLNSTTPKEYNLYIWINETGLEQMSLMDGSLKGKISVTAEAKKLNTLASNILSETARNNVSDPIFFPAAEEYAEDITSANNTTIASDYIINPSTRQFELSGTIVENASFGTEYIGHYTCLRSKTKCNNLIKIKAVEGTTLTLFDEYTAKIKSDDKGLYVQKEDNKRSEFGFPTYYYRGAVENNYVQLGTYKTDVKNKIELDSTGSNSEEKTVAHANDPILWRIVRINEDGSIKLITENNAGTPVKWHSSSAGNSVPDGIYILPDGTNTIIKNTVDNWYTSTITESNIDSKIQVGSFCNDIGDAFSTMPSRISNYLPIFKCSNGSIIANEKAGLITVDELSFAGGLPFDTEGDNITYLNNNTFFWTMTPHSYNTIYSWNSWTNKIDTGLYYWVDYRAAARTVINLKSDITINSGSGTKEDPYIIQ